jgi:predicted Zn-dependent protease
VTGQPYKLPAKSHLTQNQRMYEMVKRDGVEAAIEWFKDKGKKAAWGGTNMALAEQLIKDGRIDDGLQMMELEVELSPGKIWLLRKAAEAYLGNGHPEKALALVEKGLEQKPDDEKLATIKAEAEEDLKGK